MTIWKFSSVLIMLNIKMKELILQVEGMKSNFGFLWLHMVESEVSVIITNNLDKHFIHHKRHDWLAPTEMKYMYFKISTSDQSDQPVFLMKVLFIFRFMESKCTTDASTQSDPGLPRLHNKYPADFVCKICLVPDWVVYWKVKPSFNLKPTKLPCRLV